MKANAVAVGLVIAVLVLGSLLLHVVNEKREKDPALDVEVAAAPTHTEYLKSSLKIRPSAKYIGPKLFESFTPKTLSSKVKENSPKNATNDFSWDTLHCHRWAIVTSINAPTAAVQKQAHVNTVDTLLPDGVRTGWCLLVVADAGSPESYPLETPHNNFVYLSVNRQKELSQSANSAQRELYQSLPWGHVGRKNAGYLYAIRHGAQYIYDFDDDVILLSKHKTIHVPGESESATGGSSSVGGGSSNNGGGAAAAAAVKEASMQDIFSARIPSLPYDAEVLNPFPLFDANHNPSWPRGFPSERILSNSSTHDAPIAVTSVTVPADSVGVVQYLANHDPDVDSLYRLIRPLPLDFPLRGMSPLLLPGQNTVGGVRGSLSETAIAGSHRNSFSNTTTTTSTTAKPTTTTITTPVTATTATTTANPLITIAAPTHTVYAPYNSQSTLHTKNALFATLLPLTSHPRVSDIWRSFIAQRLFAEIGVRVAFHSPISAHIRTPKESDLPDMLSELPLYADSLSFIKLLRAYKGTTTTLPGRMEELYVHLYEQGFIGLEDVQLVQRWLQALVECGYDFPALVH